MAGTRQLNQRKKEVSREMLASCGGIRGTLVSLYAMCNRHSCDCHGKNRKKHGLAHYISSSTPKGTRMLYVPKPMLEKAKEAIEQYRKLKRAIEELSDLNRAIFEEEKNR